MNLKLIFAGLVLSTGTVLAAESAAEPKETNFTLAGAQRTALIYAPATAAKDATPVVFIFHGHGGTARGVARSFAIHHLWPEAIAVYMQGLNTPGRLTDPEGKKPGWQHRPGDQGDRDLKFFDAVLAQLKKDYRVDAKRIFSTGHSNGGGFTYLLWATRGEVFAAMAPSGAAAPTLLGQLKPKPVLHVAGEKDPLVKFEWQKATLEFVRRLNGCAADGKKLGEFNTLYASTNGTPLVTYIHPGGHGYPTAATPLIVKFFREQPATKAAKSAAP
jgi:polyhydroxybutyrate depolymerase